MDKPLAIQHDKKTSKPKHRQNPQKPKKKQAATVLTDQVKVVYISNPVNFYTSASEFRSLVQQLTGKDSYYNLDDDTTSVGGRQQHQDNSSLNASMEVVKDLEIETEEIASSSPSLNCKSIVTSDHHNYSTLLDIGGHDQAAAAALLYNDDVYHTEMLDNFWYDQY